MRPAISACVLTYNEESKIERCLRSLSWCDEILVVDSHSTDRTVELCRSFNAKVFHHEWLGYVGQRNLIRELAGCPWLLFIDSDEEVSPALRDEILAQFANGQPKYVGFEFPRMVFYVGKWIRHGEWYPDVKLRLFRKDVGRTEGIEPHDKVAVNGPVKRLSAPIYHYTYDDIHDHLDTINRFSTITARQRFTQENPLLWSDLLLRPFLRFLKGYVLKRGFMDGMHGLVIAILNSYGVFVKYAKLWELAKRRHSSFQQFPAPMQGLTDAAHPTASNSDQLKPGA